MKLLQLELKNIGPFLGQNIVFDDLNDKSKQQVTIITGENGSGKTIIIDAIRYLFYGYRRPSTERNIVKDEFDF